MCSELFWHVAAYFDESTLLIAHGTLISEFHATCLAQNVSAIGQKTFEWATSTGWWHILKWFQFTQTTIALNDRRMTSRWENGHFWCWFCRWIHSNWRLFVHFLRCLLIFQCSMTDKFRFTYDCYCFQLVECKYRQFIARLSFRSDQKQWNQWNWQSESLYSFDFIESSNFKTKNHPKLTLARISPQHTADAMTFGRVVRAHLLASDRHRVSKLFISTCWHFFLSSSCICRVPIIVWIYITHTNSTLPNELNHIAHNICYSLKENTAFHLFHLKSIDLFIYFNMFA